MNYQFNSYVNRQEAEALKEMIFRRAKERSQVMTSDVQTDVMNVARESFVSNNNPFSQIVSSAPEAKAAEPEVVEQPEEPKTDLHSFVNELEEQSVEVGFPQKNLFSGAVTQNKVIQEQASAREIQTTMKEAREALSNKKSFMGALSFLNSQAAISLLNKRAGSGVDIVA